MLNKNFIATISVPIVNAVSTVTGPAHRDNTGAVNWQDSVAELRTYRSQIHRALRAAAHVDECSDERDIAQLSQLLNDPEPFVREAAARPLARLQGVTALPMLLRAMRECERAGTPSRSLSNIAAQLVRTHQTDIEPLLQSMLGDSASDIRKDAAWCFGFLDESIAQAPLLLALRDSDRTVRIAAANALRGFGNPVVLAALSHSLFDSDEQVRVAVAATLSQIATPEVIPALARARHDCSQAVRVFATYALKRLGMSEDPLTQSSTFIQRATARTLQKLFARA